MYYGAASGQYGSSLDCGNVTTCTVSNLGPGTYYFAVTAYDASGGSSGFSNEVSTVIPPGTDTQPPVISSVTSSGLSYTGAIILWLTDEPADSQVEYGTSTAYGAVSVIDKTMLTSHSVALGGLNPGTVYHYRVYSHDAAGNVAVSSDYTFTTPVPPDTTPPTISGVAVSAVTASGATISWTTSEASDSQVDYGLSTAYGTSTALGASLVTSHSQTLIGLSGNTTYHYRVKSRDAAGNLAVSGDFMFTTPAPPDTTPPAISGVAASGVTASGATISWTTSEVSDSQVDYGPSASYGASTSLGTSMVTFHSQTLTGLSGNTTYHYRVKSRDAAGNLAVSGDYTFTTPVPPDTTPPAISGVAASGVTASGATISWTTSEASDSQADYGPSSAYGASTSLGISMVTFHSQTLTGLASNTTYHYRVKSRDAAGNLAVSGDYTFTTSSGLDIATGLVAAYAFDEGAGSTTADSSVYANTAILNGTKWTANSRYGYALSFNGNNSFVSAVASEMPDLGGPKTIACWVYLFGKMNISQSVVALANASQQAAIKFGVENSEIGDMQYGRSWLVASYPPSLRAWHHYAYTFDGSENRLYIDGALVSSSTIPPQSGPATSLEFGRWIAGSEYFKGIIDEVRVYNRPLDQEEIAAVMITPIGSPVATTTGASQPVLREAAVNLIDGRPGTARVPAQASRPVIGVRMSKSAYQLGDSVNTSSYWISNPSDEPLKVEVKSWLSAPGREPVAVSAQGSNSLLELPAGLDRNLGTLEIFQVSPMVPAGAYQFNVRMIDPITGTQLAGSHDSFSIGTPAETSADRPRHPGVQTPPWLAVENVIGGSDQERVRLTAGCRIANRGTRPEFVEVKVWLQSQEDDSLMPVLSLGADGSLMLPAGSAFSMDPLAPFLSANNVPSGLYQLRTRVLDPATGEILYEGLNYLDMR